MSRIILETLQNKLNQTIKKRDTLYNELQRNHYSEIIDIRERFKDLLHRHGCNSKEVNDFANKNADKEKELMKKAKYVIHNGDKMSDKVLEYDRQIHELSNEIYSHTIRK